MPLDALHSFAVHTSFATGLRNRRGHEIMWIRSGPDF